MTPALSISSGWTQDQTRARSRHCCPASSPSASAKCRLACHVMPRPRLRASEAGRGRTAIISFLRGHLFVGSPQNMVCEGPVPVCCVLACWLRCIMPGCAYKPIHPAGSAMHVSVRTICVRLRMWTGRRHVCVSPLMLVSSHFRRLAVCFIAFLSQRLGFDSDSLMLVPSFCSALTDPTLWNNRCRGPASTHPERSASAWTLLPHHIKLA